MASPSTNPSTPAVFVFTSQSLRVITDERGNPWFAMADVCALLGYANSRDALAKHCRENGVAKRDTIDSMGRMQPLTYIDEGNLYRLIIKSRKPEARCFESWVCDEVLPAIRKTGQYVPPAPEPPRAAPELLNTADMTNLARLVWLMSHRMPRKDAWVHGIWRRLRAVTGVPSPQRFEVRHLPILAAEARRLFRIGKHFQRAVADAERTMIRQVLRGDADAGAVLAQIEHDLKQESAKDLDQANECLAQWREEEITALLERRAPSLDLRAYAEALEPTNR